MATPAWRREQVSFLEPSTSPLDTWFIVDKIVDTIFLIDSAWRLPIGQTRQSTIIPPSSARFRASPIVSAQVLFHYA
eukprot:1989009-Pleurochrysis_carterae.AAC.5